MITLENLLNSDDFDESTSQLTKQFRKEHGLPNIDQIAFAVESVEVAASALETNIQISPFLISEARLPNWTERGVTKPFLGKLGIAYHQDMQIELLEAGTGSDFYAQLISEAGSTRLHHLGFFVTEISYLTQRLENAGYPLCVKGRSKVASMLIDFEYIDTFKELGFYLEFIRFTVEGQVFIPESKIFKKMALKQQEKRSKRTK